MWVLGKIRESMESLPLELSRYMGQSEENIFLSSKTCHSCNLHNNILTPDKIPEFHLPPRLRKRNPLLDPDTVAPYLHGQSQAQGSTSSNTTHEAKEGKNGDAFVAGRAAKKPLPFSAEGYGLAGIYESPNTRRKESLFHSKGPVYMFDRSTTSAAPRLEKESKLPKKTLSGFLPNLLRKWLSVTEHTESETPSPSPLSSPYCAKSYNPSGSGRLKGAMSCPSLTDSWENRGRWKRGGVTTSPSCPPSLKGSSLTLCPPVLFPLDDLQCQERIQREHILPLQGHLKVRLFAEQTISTNTFSSLSTVRVRVISVEGLWEDTDQQTLNCAVNLCLTPGKLQQQESATIRNCQSHVFNEDFFFIELSREDLLELQLRLRVVNKPAAGALRRGKVIGVVSKPLSQLLRLKKQVEE